MSTPTTKALITSISHDGRGITHVDGKIVFVEGALPEEEVRFIYGKRHKNFDEAFAAEIIKPAATRVTPKCRHFGICGGCNLQHMESGTQLALKQNSMLEQLEHFGQIAPQEILPPITGPIYGYRCKARLSVKFVTKKNKVLVGFHEKNGRFIADIAACPILHDSVATKITELAQLISGLSTFQYIPQIEIAVGNKEPALVLRHLKEFSQDDLKLLKNFAKEFNFKIYLQPKGKESVHCLTDENLYLNYSIDKNTDNKCELLFHPCDFTQVNQEINQKMIAQVIELLEPQKSDSILDLFCGLGNFTIPLAKRCARIIGIEGDNEMVKRGQENAAYNNVDNANFHKCDLAQEAEKIAQESWAKLQFDKILLDPPRTGALEIVKLLPKLNPKKIVYVSCNPSTLARDAKELAIQNYTLTKIGIIDMFPHTSHVETIALFCK
jgi:23S rRNA (uracil1939-C5)-methyltransferase